MQNQIKYIAFDADDTLWVNETYFRETEKKFFSLLKNYMPAEELNNQLYKTEIKNLPDYGYGIKAFMLSLIETALFVSKNELSNSVVSNILELGKEMINMPIELIDGVVEILENLSKKYKLIVATKGDLLDQERKLKKSGLEKYFHHIEVMSDKQEINYQNLIKHLDILPKEFLMIGNSMKSDILPVLAIGGKAAYVPFHTTWIHEQIEDKEFNHNCCFRLNSIKEILNFV
jgi:putative hydrolase of the HAD superfamily